MNRILGWMVATVAGLVIMVAAAGGEGEKDKNEWDPVVVKLLDPGEQNEAMAKLVTRWGWPAVPPKEEGLTPEQRKLRARDAGEAPSPIARVPVLKVFLCPQSKGPPVVAVHMTHPDADRPGPVVLVDVKGRMVSYRYVEGPVMTVGERGELATVVMIGVTYGSVPGKVGAKVLQVVPLTAEKDPEPILQVAFGQIKDEGWRYQVRQDADGTRIVLGKKDVLPKASTPDGVQGKQVVKADSLEVAATYVLDLTKGAFTGPDGGAGQEFMRLRKKGFEEVRNFLGLPEKDPPDGGGMRH